MKILIYGDIHHGSGFRYGREVGEVNSRLRVSLEAENFISKVAKENNVDLIVFLGDLVDASSRAHINDVIRLNIKERTQEFPHIFVVGNHDLFMKGQSFYKDVLRMLKGEVVDGINVFSIAGYRIGVGGWLADDEALLKRIRAKEADFWFLHKEIKGGFLRKDLISEEGLDLSDEELENIKIFCGHHHVPALMKNIIFAGSAICVDLNDARDGRERGIYLWDTDYPDSIDFLTVPVSQIVLLELRVNDLDEVRRSLKGLEGNCVVMRAEGSKEVIMDLLSEKEKLIEEFSLENLTIQPSLTDSGPREVILTQGETQEERLKKFVEGSETGMLEKRLLYEKGMEVLTECLK